jgi:methylthioxylose transferase
MSERIDGSARPRTRLPGAGQAIALSLPARADRFAAAAGVGLFAVAAAVAVVLAATGHPVHAGAAPLFADWLPHVGPGTPIAVAIAAVVIWRGPTLAATLPWRRLLAIGYATATAWILGLALVDGWQRGLAGRLTTRYEYLHEVPGVTDIPTMLGGFTARILDHQPGSWTTHVAGHPPGALLVFVTLDRVGLGGGGWAAVTCVLVGALTAVAVPQTVRLLGDEPAARACIPFAVLFPGAVWIGASADGLFAGVSAAAIALIARGLVRPAPVTAFLGGVLLAFGAYLSYGLVLLAPIVLAGAVAARRARPLLWPAAGAALVVVAFTAAGFSWLDGYHLTVERYHQGLASRRPYLYWVFADLAVLVASAGPAAAAILRRAAVGRDTGARRLLPLAAAVAIVAADLSGYSKAEVERIWLPFAIWLTAGAGLLPGPDRRTWLAVQATTALLINHLLLTTW